MNKRNLLIIIIVVLIIVLAIMSVFIVYSNLNNNNYLNVNKSSSHPVSDIVNNVSKSPKNSNILSKTVHFTDYSGTNVEIGHGDNIGLIYSPYEGQFEANSLSISLWCYDGEYAKYHRLIKAKVYYENSNGKTITKTYSGENIYKKVPKGYTPIKAVVFYEMI